MLYTKYLKILTRLCSTRTLQCVPVIKLPVYVKQQAKKTKIKDLNKERLLKRSIIYRGNTSIPVISSTNKENNYYLGQVYNEKYPIPLDSKMWYRTNCSGQKFTINPWDSNPSLPIVPKAEDVDMLFPTHFSQLISDRNILKQLQECGMEYPTGIQVLTIPKILDNKHVLFAAETGSGKTISYLAPVLERLAAIKKKGDKSEIPDTPLALILVPGKELAVQIGLVAHNLNKYSKLAIKVLVSDGIEFEELIPYDNSNVDVLVASIGTFKILFKKGIFKIANLEYLVLDEADTLLDDTFIEDTSYILQHVQIKSETFSANHGAKVIMASSIFPSNLDAILSEGFSYEDITTVRTPYLHRVLPHVKQRFWRVNNENRAGELLHLVKEDFWKKNPVLVFCNRSTSCDWISYFLKENGVPNVKFHGAVPPRTRSKNFEDFKDGAVNVMCCTDLVSRGLDTQWVKHVINFDFPNNVSDYILRAGRVGRVGSNQGYITSLVVTAPGAVAVQAIERAVRQSSRISNVNSNIRQKIKKLYYNF